MPAKMMQAPPIPDPDYSLSESDGENENSILLARNTKMNEHISLAMPVETSGNSNTRYVNDRVIWPRADNYFFFRLCSGSSTGSNSISHSFSVDEIQKIRVSLKSSKSYPNDLLRQENQLLRPDHIEEGDNSSSGVSSDQEVTVTHHHHHHHTHQPMTEVSRPQVEIKKPSVTTTITAIPMAKKSTTSQTLPLANNIKKNVTTIVMERDDRSDDDDSPSPPAKGFQRHNSLTRKQAASIAMTRAMQSRPAVSLVKLPPPIEADHESDSSMAHMPHGGVGGGLGNSQSHAQQHDRRQATENIVLAPPPQFCDCINANITNSGNSGGGPGSGARSVRIVGAVPKVNKNLPIIVNSIDLCD